MTRKSTLNRERNATARTLDQPILIALISVIRVGRSESPNPYEQAHIAAENQRLRVSSRVTDRAMALCVVFNCDRKEHLNYTILASKLRQQQLPAWQPILTASTVIPTVIGIGIIFIPIGVALFLASESGACAFTVLQTSFVMIWRSPNPKQVITGIV
ncbi:unnamed protein product [Strongylus vulgaris]|uniref:Uncharacterized protein n=1 Tax=Strongylus vulgaris TaxID=40348 RepID=A0A3P7K123_STRVU|nr:unnamed protein product [Strongylus vulgaris]